MQSWIFSIITQVLSVMWSFRNISNMLIWWSRNIFLSALIDQFLIEQKVEKNNFFAIEMFCNIINVFYCNF